MGLNDEDKPNPRAEVLEVQVAADMRVDLPETDWEKEWQMSMNLLRSLQTQTGSSSLTLPDKELLDLRFVILMNRALIGTFIRSLEDKESKWHSDNSADRQQLVEVMTDVAHRLYQHNSIMRGLMEKLSSNNTNSSSSSTPAPTPAPVHHPGSCIHLRK